MKKLLSIAVALVLISSMFCAANVNLAHAQLTTLTPGEPATIEQTLDVNIVFVGIPSEWIDNAIFDSWMLQHYSTVIRSRLWYTLDGQNPIVEPLGLEFDFVYNKIYADTQFSSDLFTYIHENSVEYGQGPPYNTGATVDVTLRQQSYNSLTASERAGFNITGPNHMVEAQLVESWLETHALSDLGVDAVNEYTVFFLSGLDSYFAHTYWFIDEPDPDTGAVFGYYGSRVLTGWGGQYGRSWFLDLSAGPDKFLFRSLYPNAATYSSAVRPIWEFKVANPTLGYRTDFSKRLAMITRFVAVDMLFTPSPLYPPYLQPPVLPDKILIDTNMFEHSTMMSGADYYTPGLAEQVYEDLQPYIDYTETFEDRQLSDYPVLKKAFENWAAYNTKSIYGKRSPYWQYAYAGIDFHLYFTDELFRFLTTQEMQESQADYAVRIFGFTIDDDYMGAQWGLGGRADDNWVDGTQECTYLFNTPYWTYNVGYGVTMTLIHETGHHLGLSHPHDGEDPVYGEVYYLGQFIWVGDNSYTVMHYHDLTCNMGVFNKDSMNRYMTITYLNYANKILKLIYENPLAGKVAGMITSADALASEALGDYESMEYLDAVMKMKEVYDTVVAAALSLYIPLEPYNWQSNYMARTVTLFDPLIDP